MEIENRHHRLVPARADRIVRLLSDLERLWPAQLAPPPRPRAHGLYDAGPMLWQEIERPGAARAFRVLEPEGLRAEHAFEVAPLGALTVVCHTVWGDAVGDCETLWTERIEPLHDRILEALLDNIEAAVGARAAPATRPAAGQVLRTARVKEACTSPTSQSRSWRRW